MGTALYCNHFLVLLRGPDIGGTTLHCVVICWGFLHNFHKATWHWCVTKILSQLLTKTGNLSGRIWSHIWKYQTQFIGLAPSRKKEYNHDIWLYMELSHGKILSYCEFLWIISMQTKYQLLSFYECAVVWENVFMVTR